MMTLHADTITCSDALEFTQSLPDCSVNCVGTSVPYYGQRDYGTGRWEGGDPDCAHVAGELRRGKGLANSPASTRGGAKKIAEVNNIQYRDECARCGAKRIDRQMGLEQTPQEYIQKMVELFREIRRVLRDDGVAFVNIGDSYSSGGRGSSDHHRQKIGSKTAQAQVLGPRSAPDGMGPKNLMLIPFRFAIALQDDGWIVRSDIIWHKPNAMPESVEDRPTTAHEHIFLLSKSPKYFYDADSIREPQTGNTHSRGNGSSPKEIPQHDGMVKSNHSFNSSMTAYTEVPGGRNKRSVWTVATESNSFAHFAMFPQALIEPMILAGCPAKVCAKCGEPWRRVTENGLTAHDGKTDSAYAKGSSANRLALLRQSARERGEEYTSGKRTLGWKPSCNCNADVDAGIVFDPFMGSGTTALVARRLGRHWIGCDLNPDYVSLANDRLTQSDPFQDRRMADGMTQLSLFSEKP